MTKYYNSYEVGEFVDKIGEKYGLSSRQVLTMFINECEWEQERNGSRPCKRIIDTVINRVESWISEGFDQPITPDVLASYRTQRIYFGLLKQGDNHEI
jgi:hypothetical protein